MIPAEEGGAGGGAADPNTPEEPATPTAEELKAQMVAKYGQETIDAISAENDTSEWTEDDWEYYIWLYRNIEDEDKSEGEEDSGESGTDAINLINGLPANQGYDSFRKLKNAIGSPGEGNHWHHIVEQSQIGKSGFSAQQIHNTSNIIAVDAATHAKITGYYNTTTYKFTGGLSVRDWLAGQSYEYQYEFGLNVLREYGVIE